MSPVRPRWSQPFNTLKLQITLGGIAALVLGISLVSALTVRRAETDTLRAERLRELTASVRTAALVSRRVVALQRALQVTALEMTPDTLIDEKTLGRFLVTKSVLLNMFDNIFVLELDGQLKLAATERGLIRPDVNVGDRAYFQRTVAESRPLVSPPLPSRFSGEPVLAFTHPVRGPHGVIAVLGGTLRLNSRDVLEGLVDNQEEESRSLVAVTDPTGRLLAHPDAKLLTHSIADDARLSQAFSAWQASGSPIEPMGVGLEQRGQLVSAAGVAGPDWVVWRARPEAELLAPLRQARREALTVTAGLIVVLSGVMLLVLWRLLRPLTQLARRARHMFDGTLAPQDGWPVAGGEIGSLSDVLRTVSVERTQLERANNAALRRLNSVMSAAPVGIAVLRDGCFETVSPEFCRLLGHPEAELIGAPVESVLADPPEDAAQVTRPWEAGHAHLPFAAEWRMRRRDGTTFWADVRSRLVDSDDVTQGEIWTLSDIDNQRQARTQLEWSAMHDLLTGLENRAAFEQHARALVDTLPHSLPAAMVFIDLDRFKPVNDTAGHAMGDRMLRVVAEAIAAQVRADDHVARLGGDEFALLLRRCQQDAAERIAQDVCRAVQAIALPWEGGVLGVGASVGVAPLRSDTPSVEAWTRAADAACYAAKAAGRGTVRLAPQG
ncbi:sensor domain-containing diguanylate cyclase [Variovorax ginsengisoli]|uniref:Diguanylate cyclase (GGDEF)-like protein/PAS domain S-box-containing protein n=1 Tax=Variovorax ginsengisoli TaxID=363844 RepID=A0ABT9SAS0_9BURK|nr:diguanylate cyclase [Variovorax ginsengisoli]MDP9901310.1 diguanylate cyclase (GGDEF)-like protein/PAS domain S-box-containing protein [Variovorax ginsengisoli]